MLPPILYQIKTPNTQNCFGCHQHTLRALNRTDRDLTNNWVYRSQAGKRKQQVEALPIKWANGGKWKQFMKNIAAESYILLSNNTWMLHNLSMSLGSALVTEPPGEDGGAS